MRHKAFFIFTFVTILTFFVFPLRSFADPSSIIHSNIPEDSDASEGALPLSKERLIGKIIMQQLNASDCLVTDPVVNEYLLHIGNKLFQHAGIKDYPAHFFGIETEVLNAFAFFGGHIAVHTGLIQTIDNESELVAILAHETAHIGQKHLPRMVAQNRKLLPLTLAQILAAAAIGVMGSPEAGAHLTMAALAGHTQQMINYTRVHEQEADRIGIQLLAKSGYDPNAMASIFNCFQKHLQFQTKPPEYLNTHPLYESRIADAELRAEKLSYKQAPDSLFFHLVRARLELLRREREGDRVKRLKAILDNGRHPNKDAALYAYALALAKNRKFEGSLNILNSLAEKMPTNWIIQLSVAETEHEAQQSTLALKHLRQLMALYPTNHAIVLKYAEILLDTQSPETARLLLLKQLKYKPEDPNLYQLLVRAEAKSGHKIDCHITQANWHYLRGEFKEAQRQLDIALEHTSEKSPLGLRIRSRKLALERIFEEQKSIRL